MKAVCNGTPFMIEKISPQVGLEPVTARSVGQLLTYWATWARLHIWRVNECMFLHQFYKGEQPLLLSASFQKGGEQTLSLRVDPL